MDKGSVSHFFVLCSVRPSLLRCFLPCLDPPSLQYLVVDHRILVVLTTILVDSLQRVQDASAAIDLELLETLPAPFLGRETSSYRFGVVSRRCPFSCTLGPHTFRDTYVR